MSVFGNILKIIAIGAFFVATGPFGLTVSSTLATVLRIGGAVLGYLGAMASRPKLLYERQRYDMALDPGTPLPVVYGRAKVSGIVADWFVDTASDDKVLYMAVPFAHGSRDGLGIDAVEEIWFNNRLAVTVSGDVRKHPYGDTSVDYQVFLGSTTQNIGGTDLTGLPSVVPDKSLSDVANGGWSATTDTGKGIACVVFRFINVVMYGVSEGGEIDPSTRGPAFRGPPSVALIVSGNRVYDHRTDTWLAGGDNPAMCIRDYLLSAIYGCGFSTALIHEDSFDDAADYCDELIEYELGARTITDSNAGTDRVTTATAHGYTTGDVVRISGHAGSTPTLNGDHDITVTSSTTFTLDGVDITVGGTGGTVVRLEEVKRFTCNGALDTARTTSENLQELLSSCRGNLVWEQGAFKLTIRSDAAPAPTLALSPANIIGEWAFRNAGQDEKWNTVRATYLEPANGEFKSQDVQWPPVGETNAYLTADNSFQNRLDLALPFTNDQVMAQAIAQVTLNESRFGISCQVRCTEEAMAVSVGDQVEVTHPTPAWTDKPFWVVAMQLLPDTSVVLHLQEYDPAAYAMDTQEDRRTFPATEHPSIFDVPDPGAVTSVGLSGGGLKISWLSANYGLIDYYEVQARLTSAGEDYVTIERVRDGGTLEAIAALARAGQTWDARVRVVNIVGWPSDWVNAAQLAIPVPASLTPGTGLLTVTGFAPTVDITVNPPDLVSVSLGVDGGDSCLEVEEWTLTPGWVTTSPNDVLYRIDVEKAEDAAGTSYGAWLSNQTTDDSSVNDFTGISGNTGGVTSPTTFYRKYKIKLIRRSDSAVLEELETDQEQITVYTDVCE